MSCSPASASVIASALIACGVCGPTPVAELFTIVDRVDSSRCAPGMEVQVRLDQLQPRDSKGRHAHLRGIYIEGRANLTVADGTSDAVSNFSLRGLFNAFYLTSVTGHSYFNSLDGRNIDDDIWFRHRSRVASPKLQIGSQTVVSYPTVTAASVNALAANVGAGDYEVDASLYIPLTDLFGRRPLQGLIPLAMLKKRGADALRFKTGPGIPGSPTDVTFTGWTCADGFEGMKVWLDIVYLPALVIDPEWALSQYTKSDLSGTLDYQGETHEYIAVRYFPEDASAGLGQFLCNDIGTVTLQAGRDTIVAGYSAFEMQQRALLDYMKHPDGALAHQNSAMDLPFLASDGNSLEPTTQIWVPYAGRKVAPSGPFGWQLTSRTADFTRIAHRHVKCGSQTDAKRIAEALDCDATCAHFTDGKGNVTMSPQSNEAVVVETK